MRLLLTNDDGINAPGLERLERIARDLVGEDGDIWVVAPEREMSGVSHCISYSSPTLLAEIGPKRFTVAGYPADCVLAAVHVIMKDAPPNLILSGVNRGNNSAEATMYSGTVGAAIEGALQGINSIALSQYYGPDNLDLDDPFEASVSNGADVVRGLLEKGHWDEGGYRTFYNVNFPPKPAEAVKGIRVARQGYRQDQQFRMLEQSSPTGRSFLWVTGSSMQIPMEDGTDAAANMDGYISVTPMRADLTAYELLAPLRERLE